LVLLGLLEQLTAKHQDRSRSAAQHLHGTAVKGNSGVQAAVKQPASVCV
jgi:hypothetical protein